MIRTTMVHNLPTNLNGDTLMEFYDALVEVDKSKNIIIADYTYETKINQKNNEYVYA